MESEKEKMDLIQNLRFRLRLFIWARRLLVLTFLIAGIWWTFSRLHQLYARKTHPKPRTEYIIFAYVFYLIGIAQDLITLFVGSFLGLFASKFAREPLSDKIMEYQEKLERLENLIHSPNAVPILIASQVR
jgi:hypothetical protein